MKVVIPVAGEGSRMLHLTNNKPKPLIKVMGRPFLFYLFDNIIKAGYSEIILVVGYKASRFQKFLDNYLKQNKNLKIKVIDQFNCLGKAKGKGKKGKYGTACPLMCAEKYIGKDDFIMLYGDNLYSPKDLRKFNIDDDYNYVGGLKHKNPEKYGVLVPKNGFLNKILEKPTNPPTNLISIGLYKFTSDIFKKIPKIKPSIRGEYEITDAITLLAKENKVKIKKINDYWFDFGNPADIIKVSKFLRKNK